MEKAPLYDDPASPPASRAELSRRELLRRAGYGMAGAAALLALGGGPAEARLQRLLPGAQTARRHIRAVGDSQSMLLQLPFWGDGANWGQPQYYETIQAGRRRSPKTARGSDVDGDGQDELIARGPGGILAERFDPETGQWLSLPGNHPPTGWSDSWGWDRPQYYRTIQTADINGDGQAELLARDSQGIQAWKYDADPASATFQQWILLSYGSPAWTDANGWDNPQYYETIQCADIDGDGRDELIGRSWGGVEVWKYSASGAWEQMEGGPSWSDPDNWDRPQYYETIQCADIDGDGRAELLGRGAGGVEVWKYIVDPSSPYYRQWVFFTSETDLNDNWGWNQPQYYRTIQCADIDGDGKAELLARGSDGIFAWRFDNAGENFGFFPLPDGPRWNDANGWDNPQYYETIQCADIDGDGQEELLARNAFAVEIWRWDKASAAWAVAPGGPAWSDAAGWDEVQYYATIQTARVNGSPTNPNNLPNPNGKPVAALLGRNHLNMETWRFGVAAAAWQRPAPPFPQFAGDQLTAYSYINSYFRGQFAVGDIRSAYNGTLTDSLIDWRDALKFGLVPPPAGVSSADWQVVKTQIQTELTYAIDVQDWYSKTGSLITDVFLSDSLSASTVANALSVSGSQDDSPVTLTVFGILASGTAAALSVAAPEVSVIAGLLATSASAGLAATPGDDPGEVIQIAYADLEGRLNDAFLKAKSGTGQSQAAVMADWGLLAAVGSQIETSAWTWDPTLNSQLVMAAQYTYEVSLWQILIPLVWEVWTAGGLYLKPGYPGEYSYYNPDNNRTYWLSMSTSSSVDDFPDTSTLSALFDPQPNGLGIPLADVFLGRNGWPALPAFRFDAPPPPPHPAFPLRLDVSAAPARDPATGKIVIAAVTIANRGQQAVTNVEILQAQLKNQPTITALPSRRTRLGAGQSRTFRVHFPNIGKPGQQAVLQIRGAYKGGSFGGSLRVRLP